MVGEPVAMPQPTAEVAAGLRQHAGTPPAPRALVIAVLENPADESAIVTLESQPDSNLHSEVVEVLVGQFALLHASRPDRVLELQIRLLEQTSRGAGVDLCTAVRQRPQAARPHRLPGGSDSAGVLGRDGVARGLRADRGWRNPIHLGRTQERR